MFVRHVRMRDERTQITSLKDVFILVPRATRLNLEPTNKRRALGTRMGRLRGGEAIYLLTYETHSSSVADPRLTNHAFVIA